MHWSYSCPACQARLNPRKNIVLVAGQGEQRMLVGFHPSPGNYEVFIPPGAEVAAGTEWDFLCPVCHGDLAMENDARMCRLDVRIGSQTKKVLFSRVAGEHATFVFNSEGLEAHHGEDARLYVQHMLCLKLPR